MLALSVMVYHFALWVRESRLGIPWAVPDSPLLSVLGPGAVNLFFMITGFLFYPRIAAGAKEVDWVGLFISRTFRIVPMVFVSTGIAAGLSILFAPANPAAEVLRTLQSLAGWLTCWSQPPLFGYEQSARLNAGVLWSLRYEWAFYLMVLPAAAVARDLLRILGTPRALVPAIILGFALIARPLRGAAPLVTYLPMFVIGMIGSELASARALAPFAGSRAGSFLAAGCFVAGAAGDGAVRLLLHGIGFLLVVCGADFFGLLRSRVVRLVGECSFSLYLLHGVVLALAFQSPLLESLHGTVLAAVLPVLGTIAVLVSMLTYRLVEDPFISLGRRVAQGRRVNC